jgi:PAS domain S-box-containing protein
MTQEIAISTTTNGTTEGASKMFSALERLMELDEVESAKQRDRVAFLSLIDGLIEALPDALIVVGLDGNIVFFNRQAELMFGYPRDEVLGRPVERLLPERSRVQHIHDRELYDQFAVNRRARTMGVGLDLIGLRRDGREFAADITLSRMVSPTGILGLALVRCSPRAANLAGEVNGLPPPEQHDADADAAGH